jgi:hypothetical protein
MAWRTRSTVSAEARRVSPFTMRDTVAIDTPAFAATVASDTGPTPVRCVSVMWGPLSRQKYDKTYNRESRD